MRFDFEVTGDVQVSRELMRFAGWAGDASPAFRSIARTMRGIQEDQFASEGAVGSGGWAPLAPTTVAYKAAAGLRPEILQATGALMESLTGGPDHIEEINRDQLRFGSKVDYGKYHQTGTGRMPQRRPIEFSEMHRRDFLRTLHRYLMTGQTVL